MQKALKLDSTRASYLPQSSFSPRVYLQNNYSQYELFIDFSDKLSYWMMTYDALQRETP